MKYLISVILLCLAACVGAAPSKPTAPVPPADQLEQDGRILTGTLENGVQWMYRNHDNPPDKMSILMHVGTGSLNETEEQRGLSHFMEHMIFNGTKSFPAGEMIAYFESIGMEFGADVNAFTGLEQTTYMLFTPDVEAAQVDKALLVLSECAFHALLAEEEVQKEKGVILAEKRSRMSVQQRLMDELWPELFEGSRLAQRIPIGKEEVIKGATSEGLNDYYRTWYRPERITLIVAGDAEPDKIVPFIEKHFGEYEADVAVGKEHGPEFKLFESERAFVVTDPEFTSANIQIYSMKPGRPAATTKTLYRTELVEGMGNWMVNRRYEERIKKGEARYQSAGAGVSRFFNEVMMASASAEGEVEDLEPMVEELIMEINRAREHGFTEREFELASTALLADAERAVRTEPTRSATSMLMDYNSAVTSGEPVLSAEYELALIEELLPGITREEVGRAFGKNFTPGAYAYVVTLPEKEGVTAPATNEVLASARAALSRKTSPIEEAAGAKTLLASLPAAGKVVETSMDEDLKVKSAWLDNGVRVHHRFMDYKKDTVLISVSLAGGKIEEKGEQAGVTDVASLAFNQPATSRLTSTEIADLMTGKNVTLKAQAQEDCLVLQITGSPKDVQTGLELAHILLTEGKIEETAFTNWQAGLRQQLEYLQKVPEFMCSMGMINLLSNDDTRLGPPTLESVEKQNLAAGQAWLERLNREAPIEVAVVGEMAYEEVMPLIEQYIGSLPAREKSTDRIDALRDLDRGPGPLERTIAVDTVTPKAMVIFGFTGLDPRKLEDLRAMNLASQTLSTRLINRVREEKQLVYSIQAMNQVMWAYSGMSFLYTGAPCDPAKANEVVEEAKSVFTDFAEKGPTAEELENAKKQIANNFDTRRKTPAYWWQVLMHLDLHDLDLDDYKEIQAAYDAISAEKVKATFNAFYKPSSTFTVVAAPAVKEAATPQ